MICKLPLILFRNKRYVSLKIIVANTGPTNEVHILRFLSTRPGSDQHITVLLDEFDHPGPNGLHKCLVLEPMGLSVNSMVEALPQFNPRTMFMNVRYPPTMAKGILKQALQSLNFLHENGIAHGDFQPGDILFCLEDAISTQKAKGFFGNRNGKAQRLMRTQKRNTIAQK